MSTNINQNVKTSKGRKVCYFLFMTIFSVPRRSPNTQQVFNLDKQKIDRQIDRQIQTYIGRQTALTPKHYAKLFQDT